ECGIVISVGDGVVRVRFSPDIHLDVFPSDVEKVDLRLFPNDIQLGTTVYNKLCDELRGAEEENKRLRKKVLEYAQLVDNYTMMMMGEHHADR
ncbi:MAG: hypothetical protein GWN86_00800, partial [Desulfobacterales bacterium]|nr:hypothetical protein [Candidatus Bathyarchaeota archaeon]NIR12557.1 hypothetical protein [Desulfobacterales bacterium]